MDQTFDKVLREIASCRRVGQYWPAIDNVASPGNPKPQPRRDVFNTHTGPLTPISPVVSRTLTGKFRGVIEPTHHVVQAALADRESRLLTRVGSVEAMAFDQQMVNRSRRKRLEGVVSFS